ncbi:hypothetical protein [Pseudomonas sp. R2-60-08W]|nr:hypothetical protein [Pseudomonas sp. R2-60-08W]AZF26043.1 hypothetical protein C4J90_1869 [Pseudomonas sp. R2-60-08W]
MSYLDDEIAKDFNLLNIKLVILPELKHDLIVENINGTALSKKIK